MKNKIEPFIKTLKEKACCYIGAAKNKIPDNAVESVKSFATDFMAARVYVFFRETKYPRTGVHAWLVIVILFLLYHL